MAISENLNHVSVSLIYRNFPKVYQVIFLNKCIQIYFVIQWHMLYITMSYIAAIYIELNFFAP